jgi:hypothetical protein
MQALDEVKNARIFAGIHFRFSARTAAGQLTFNKNVHAHQRQGSWTGCPSTAKFAVQTAVKSRQRVRHRVPVAHRVLHRLPFMSGLRD